MRAATIPLPATLRRGAPPWVPASEPLPPGEHYKAGLRCRACGLPHATVICLECGTGDDLTLACDRCAEWQRFDAVSLIRVRIWRVVAGMAVSFAAGLVAAAFVGRK